MPQCKSPYRSSAAYRVGEHGVPHQLTTLATQLAPRHRRRTGMPGLMPWVTLTFPCKADGGPGEVKVHGHVPVDYIGVTGAAEGSRVTLLRRGPLASLVPRTCVHLQQKGKGGSYSLGGASAASTCGSHLPRPQAQHDSFGWSPHKAASCYAQVAMPMGSMMIHVRLTQA